MAKFMKTNIKKIKIFNQINYIYSFSDLFLNFRDLIDSQTEKFYKIRYFRKTLY